MRAGAMEGMVMYDIETMRQKTILLQREFICPIWAVWFGKSVRIYFTHYHAEQMMRALRANNTPAYLFTA
jgi:hypothetical protein